MLTPEQKVEAYDSVIAECQAVFARYIAPDRLSAEEAMVELSRILDGPYLRSVREDRISVTHNHEPLTPTMKPQDRTMRGESLRFETLEHDEMTMPQAIKVTDPEGRWAIYEPTREGGKLVRSHGSKVTIQPEK